MRLLLVEDDSLLADSLDRRFSVTGFNVDGVGTAAVVSRYRGPGESDYGADADLDELGRNPFM